MVGNSNSEVVCIEDFIASKQIRLFQALKQHHFSGQLTFKNVDGLEWTFFLYLGRVIYATGGSHPVRRWRRNLVSYLPEIASKLQAELKKISDRSLENISITWDYQLLYLWVEQKKIDLDRASKTIRAIINEVLFDITQSATISYYLQSQDGEIDRPLAMVDAEQQIIESWKLWQKWQESELETTSPNLAPIIIQPEKLQEKTTEKTYATLTRLLDGKHTLRDLAVKKQTNILTVTRSILPYLKLNFLKLIQISDISIPFSFNESNDNSQSIQDIPVLEKETNLEEQPILPLSSENRKKTLIASIGANKIMNKMLGKILQASGYDFIGETEAIRAIAVLLDVKPDIIFIDLELPGISGYDLCTQLRQLSCFAQTPIFLFTRNISLIDRVKAKMSGCSELFHKSMEAQSILRILAKHTPDNN